MRNPIKKLKDRISGKKSKNRERENHENVLVIYENQRQQILVAQRQMAEQLATIERQRQEFIAHLNQSVQNFAVNAKNQITSIVNQDIKYANELKQALESNDQIFQARDRKLKQIQEALDAFETGSFEPIESLARDREVLELFGGLNRLIQKAAQIGRTEWEKLLQAKQNFQINQRQVDILNKESEISGTRKASSERKTINDKVGVTATSRDIKTEIENKIRKELKNEMGFEIKTKIESETDTEIEAAAETETKDETGFTIGNASPASNQTQDRNHEREFDQYPIYDRALSLLVYNLARDGRLNSSVELLFRTEESVQSLDKKINELMAEIESAQSQNQNPNHSQSLNQNQSRNHSQSESQSSSLSQNQGHNQNQILGQNLTQTPAQNQAQNESQTRYKIVEELIHVAQKIISQFSNDYEYQFDTEGGLQIALMTAAIGLIELLKQKSDSNIQFITQYPNQREISWIETILFASLARIVFENSPEKSQPSLVIQRVRKLFKAEWHNDFLNLECICRADPQNRKDLFYSLISQGLSSDRKMQKFETTRGGRNRLKWRSMASAYLDLTQSGRYPIGDDKILAEAKSIADKIDLEKRIQFNEQLLPNKEKMGAIAFELYYSGKIQDIFESIENSNIETVNTQVPIEQASNLQNSAITTDVRNIINDRNTRNRRRRFHEAYTSSLKKVQETKINSESSCQTLFQLLSEASESIITQVCPVRYLAGEVYHYKGLDLHKIAFAIAKQELASFVIGFPEDTREQILHAAIYSGFVRKYYADYPNGFGGDFTDNIYKLFIFSQYDESYEDFQINPENLKLNSEELNHNSNHFMNLFKYCYFNISDDFLKDVNNIITIASKPHSERIKAVSSIRNAHPKLLLQANLMHSYQLVFNQHDYDGMEVFNPVLFKEAQQLFSLLGKMQQIKSNNQNNNQIDNEIHDQVSAEDDLECWKIILEKIIHQLVLNNRFFDMHFSIERKLELDRIRAFFQGTNRALEDESNINLAVQVLNQCIPGPYQGLELNKAMAMAHIAVAETIHRTEDDTRVLAIVITALARQYLQRRMQGSLGCINELDRWKMQGQELFVCDSLYGIKLTKEQWLVKMVEDIRDLFRRREHSINQDIVKQLLTISRKTSRELAAYKNSLPKPKFTQGQIIDCRDTIETWHSFINISYITSANHCFGRIQYFNLIECYDLISAYRNLTKTGNYLPGDVRILQEAYLIAENDIRYYPFSNFIPVMAHPWTPFRLTLDENQRCNLRIISQNILNRETNHIHRSFQILVNQARESMNVFNVSMVREPMMTQIQLPSNMTLGNFEPIGNGNNFNNLNSSTTTPVFLPEGLNRLEWMSTNGKTIGSQAIFIQKRSFLKKPLQDCYSPNIPYVIEFDGLLSGSVTLERTEQDARGENSSALAGIRTLDTARTVAATRVIYFQRKPSIEILLEAADEVNKDNKEHEEFKERGELKEFGEHQEHEEHKEYSEQKQHREYNENADHNICRKRKCDYKITITPEQSAQHAVTKIIHLNPSHRNHNISSYTLNNSANIENLNNLDNLDKRVDVESINNSNDSYHKLLNRALDNLRKYTEYQYGLHQVRICNNQDKIRQELNRHLHALLEHCVEAGKYFQNQNHQTHTELNKAVSEINNRQLESIAATINLNAEQQLYEERRYIARERVREKREDFLVRTGASFILAFIYAPLMAETMTLNMTQMGYTFNAISAETFSMGVQGALTSGFNAGMQNNARNIIPEMFKGALLGGLNQYTAEQLNLLNAETITLKNLLLHSAINTTASAMLQREHLGRSLVANLGLTTIQHYLQVPSLPVHLNQISLKQNLNSNRSSVKLNVANANRNTRSSLNNINYINNLNGLNSSFDKLNHLFSTGQTFLINGLASTVKTAFVQKKPLIEAVPMAFATSAAQTVAKNILAKELETKNKSEIKNKVEIKNKPESNKEPEVKKEPDTLNDKIINNRISLNQNKLQKAIKFTIEPRKTNISKLQNAETMDNKPGILSPKEFLLSRESLLANRSSIHDLNFGSSNLGSNLRSNLNSKPKTFPTQRPTNQSKKSKTFNDHMLATEQLEDAFSNQDIAAHFAGVAGAAIGAADFTVDAGMSFLAISADAEKLIDDPKHLHHREKQIAYIKKDPIGISKEVGQRAVFSFINRLDNIQNNFAAGKKVEAMFDLGEMTGYCAGAIIAAARTASSAGKGLLFSIDSGKKGLTSGHALMKDFMSTRTLQSPITIKFSQHINCGIPIDEIGIRNPLKTSSEKQHKKILEKLGATIYKEHVDLQAGAGGLHGYENFAKAREVAKIYANLGNETYPYLQKIGPYRNMVYTGMKNKDGSRGWRLDFDPNDIDKGVHVNWWYKPDINSKSIFKGTIKIENANQDIFQDILSHFPKR